MCHYNICISIILIIEELSLTTDYIRLVNSKFNGNGFKWFKLWDSLYSEINNYLWHINYLMDILIMCFTDYIRIEVC